MRHGRPIDALNEAELSRARALLAEGLSSGPVLAARAYTEPRDSSKLPSACGATIFVYWLGEKALLPVGRHASENDLLHPCLLPRKSMRR